MASFIENLESRLLLSAAPHKASATIIQDEATVLQARNQIRTDQLAIRTKLSQDHADLAQALATQKGVIKLDSDKLHADRGNAALVAVDQAQLKADRLQIITIRAANKTTVATDRANSKATLTADKAALKTAILKLGDDRRAGL
jgi:hypothetical protein